MYRSTLAFDPPQTLVERLGEDFFRALPSGPGVYFMCGATEAVLYVGKAYWNFSGFKPTTSPLRAKQARACASARSFSTPSPHSSSRPKLLEPEGHSRLGGAEAILDKDR
jgi:hypothetical protein